MKRENTSQWGSFQENQLEQKGKKGEPAFLEALESGERSHPEDNLSGCDRNVNMERVREVDLEPLEGGIGGQEKGALLDRGTSFF